MGNGLVGRRKSGEVEVQKSESMHGPDFAISRSDYECAMILASFSNELVPLFHYSFVGCSADSIVRLLTVFSRSFSHARVNGCPMTCCESNVSSSHWRTLTLSRLQKDYLIHHGFQPRLSGLDFK